MIAVRANATTGFKFGKAAISGRRVKPMARRAGTTSSRALQIVGLSNSLNTSRSAGSGRVGTSAFLGSLLAKDVRGKTFPARGCEGQMPILPALINNPSGKASARMASTTAKQRSARLHLFQSKIQSRIQQPPPNSGSSIIDRRGENSTEL